ncbi:LEC14B homolog isoform X2 [Amborella trichopoda]|uniref:LEC14B homolog isoform X2 n=1 Tax=Amborella trichopoda TaxID=13333 RepID=UPI0005D2F21A|nr:LEC14B homolog isoform X2 [Amborella trichopoda]|eukprot:XP_011628001.1 LEC14B homolog isoform X2 [Amborella trichopoda]
MDMMDGEEFIDDLNYARSSIEKEFDIHDCDRPTQLGRGTQAHLGQFPVLDNEIAHSIKVRSKPSDMISRITRAKASTYVSTVKMLLGRESNYSGKGRFSSADCCHVLSRYVPVNGPWIIDKTESRAYTSQFSADGTFFITGFQDRNIRIYDVDNGWKVQKDIRAKNLSWTITDTSLSPDQRFLVYSSMSPIVHIVNVGTPGTLSIANVNEIHEELDFSGNADGGRRFSIFSVNFSSDGRKLVAGSNDHCLYIYDMEANKPTLRILAHEDDVNTVSFADESGNLIYSGSDDSFCKVWDMRCTLSGDRPSGVLVGHLEGITFLDSRRDGHYFISNGKDQTTKLWDIRKMASSIRRRRRKFSYSEWDYRWMDYPAHRKDVKHPNDQSVATYRGHSVLRTLIRCYFSPASSTGQKYIYTGSNDGCVYIYDVISGALVGKTAYHDTTVRDCSWHPHFPMLISSGWDGIVAGWEISERDQMNRKKSQHKK